MYIHVTIDIPTGLSDSIKEKIRDIEDKDLNYKLKKAYDKLVFDVVEEIEGFRNANKKN